MNNSETQYIDLYGQCREMICRHSCDVMNGERDEAFADFKRLGFPTKKVEEYKYTDMQALFAPDLGLNLQRLDIPVNPYDVFKCDVPNLSTQLYFVVNDQFYDKLLPKVELPKGVIVDSLCKMAKEKPEVVARYYNRQASSKVILKNMEGATSHKDGMDEVPEAALNTMLAQDGLFIYVPKGVHVERTVQVINILRSDVDLMINRRVLVVLEEDAQLNLLFCDHAADDRQFLTNQVVEVFVGENARLDITCLEETHYKSTRVSNVFVNQKGGSRVDHNVITLHNGVTRNRTILTLDGEGAECYLNGCVIADKQQHVDNTTLIDHKVPHCDSHELYKYVINDKAVGSFAGKVLVRKGADKTSSQMTNQNLCATNEARMFTQPMLEIYADDVKCSHGSTVGQLNDKALFYMQQRGISLEEARMLLQNAFVGEVIERIQLAPLRDRLHYLVEKRFRGELNKCEGCKLCK